jgi:hypothetical protein
MPLVTRMVASSEHAWDPMASSSAGLCQKTRTAPCHTRLRIENVPLQCWHHGGWNKHIWGIFTQLWIGKVVVYIVTNPNKFGSIVRASNQDDSYTTDLMCRQSFPTRRGGFQHKLCRPDRHLVVVRDVVECREVGNVNSWLPVGLSMNSATALMTSQA